MNLIGISVILAGLVWLCRWARCNCGVCADLFTAIPSSFPLENLRYSVFPAVGLFRFHYASFWSETIKSHKYSNETADEYGRFCVIPASLCPRTRNSSALIPFYYGSSRDLAMLFYSHSKGRKKKKKKKKKKPSAR